MESNRTICPPELVNELRLLDVAVPIFLVDAMYRQTFPVVDIAVTGTYILDH